MGLCCGNSNSGVPSTRFSPARHLVTGRQVSCVTILAWAMTVRLPGCCVTPAWWFSLERSGRGKAAPGWVDWQGTCGVLRRLPVPAESVSAAGLADDVEWLHFFLARLAAPTAGVMRPRPVRG